VSTESFTAIQPPADSLYLGSNASDGSPLFYESANFTTHGVIVGMTGSGKTGLGVVLLEEALQAVADRLYALDQRIRSRR